jgi:hypothetical protein
VFQRGEQFRGVPAGTAKWGPGMGYEKNRGWFLILQNKNKKYFSGGPFRTFFFCNIKNYPLFSQSIPGPPFGNVRIKLISRYNIHVWGNCLSKPSHRLSLTLKVMLCIVSVPEVRIQQRNMVFWIDCLKDMAVDDLINPRTVTLRTI